MLTARLAAGVAGWGVRTLLVLSVSVLGTSLAAQPLLKPLPLSAACQRAGYTALQDSAGTLRVLRYVRLIPDNTARLTQYYSAAGRLQSLKASASGFTGLLYDLSVTVDARGNTVTEKGYRSRLYRGLTKDLIRDAADVRAGRCQP